MTKKYAYSEIFMSMQGEGMLTGTPGPWLRFHLCNLQCDGFFQDNPMDPSTYKLPYKDFDTSTVERVEDLPVFEYGCDSSYTWSKRFKHLMKKETASEICDKIIDSMKNEYNPDGLFVHPITDLDQHMHFTGGEPMMKHGQEAMVEIMKEFIERDNYPRYVTIETNGTQIPTDVFIDYWEDLSSSWRSIQLFWSISPKLYSVTGETHTKAINVEAVAKMMNSDYNGQLKFVVNGTEECWIDLEDAIAEFEAELEFSPPIFLMPVGATKEQQESDDNADLVNEIIARGYLVSGRLHCHIFGNAIGT